MIMIKKKLKNQRLLASINSGGKSGFSVRSKVINTLKNLNTDHKFLLDFGSGKGELLQILFKTFKFKKLCGIDLYKKSKKLSNKIDWIKTDLNNNIKLKNKFDFIICTEVIEHLENPRQTLRNIHDLMKPKSTLILTMPNNESIRALVAIIFGGHFALFLGNSYPAHITALLKLDLIRICKEIGFSNLSFFYTDNGCVPKFTRLTWQNLSYGLLKGKYFSDNILMIAKKK